MAKIEKLVVQAQAGETAAYDEVYRQFQHMALSYAFSLLGDHQLAEDARQEAFLAAYVDLLALRDPAAFPGWFKRIVRNHSIMLRRGRGALLVPLGEVAEPLAAAAGPARLAEKRQRQEFLQRAIERLPVKEREVIRSYHLDECSLKETARRLGITTDLVRSRLYTGRRRLREKLMRQIKSIVREQDLAGDPTARQAATAAAVGQFDDELQTLLKTPTPAELERASDLLCAKGRLLRFMGEMQQAVAAFENGLAQPLFKGLPLHRARLRAEIGLTLVQTADYTEARKALQAAKRPLQDKPNHSLLMTSILNGLGMCAWGQSRFRQAREFYEQALNAVAQASAQAGMRKEEGARANNEILETEVRNNLALLDWKAGRLERALRNFRGCLRVWKKINNRFQWVLALLNAGVLEENLGRAAAARRHYEQALRTSREINFRQVQVASLINLANLELGRKKWDTALEQSERALELAREIGDRRNQTVALENRALAEIGLERWRDAAATLRQARKLARAIGDDERQLSLELAAAELALARDCPQGLAAKLTQAKRRLKQIDCRAELPRLLRLKAQAEFQTGAKAHARRTLERGLAECKKQRNRLEEGKLLALKIQHERETP